MISTITILYIVLLIFFVLSIAGILRSDKDDNAGLFYSSAVVFILAIVGAASLWFAVTYLVMLED